MKNKPELKAGHCCIYGLYALNAKINISVVWLLITVHRYAFSVLSHDTADSKRKHNLYSCVMHSQNTLSLFQSINLSCV
jgi:hypothetical protein